MLDVDHIEFYAADGKMKHGGLPNLFFLTFAELNLPAFHPVVARVAQLVRDAVDSVSIKVVALQATQ